MAQRAFAPDLIKSPLVSMGDWRTGKRGGRRKGRQGRKMEGRGDPLASSPLGRGLGMDGIL